MWQVEVGWAPEPDFCKQCVSTGLVDILHMTWGQEAQGEMRELLRCCPWLGNSSEGDITNTEIYFQAMNLMYKVWAHNLDKDGPAHKTSLELLQGKIQGP